MFTQIENILRSVIAIVSVAAEVALVLTILLTLKSLLDFSHTGPQIRNEIKQHFAGYALYSVFRLAFWGFLILWSMAIVGIITYGSFAVIFDTGMSWWGAVFAAMLGISLITFVQFSYHLLHHPSLIASSSNYRLSRFYLLWQRLSPQRIKYSQYLLVAIIGFALIGALVRFVLEQRWLEMFSLIVLVGAGIIILAWSIYDVDPHPALHCRRQDTKMPNILMIGADSLRSDRLGLMGYPREVAPFLDSLVERGTVFPNCYVPLARTAPSLASLLTGAWPHRHGIRENYVADYQTALPTISLPKLLKEAGYRSMAISDWAGGDLGKLNFGFDETDLPCDQWNLKYLLRQGPKDIRFFLSLFTHNRFGKMLLPELYYLAGVPLTTELGRSARQAITAFAEQEQPFFINLFMATTHAPFGSEYPYYQLYSSPDYKGEAKFVMIRSSDPEEVIESQRLGKKDFDFPQVINLYDGCVKHFDEEVEKIVAHLEKCGLAENTILVIYSDHGLDLFEKETWGQGNTVMGNDASARTPLIVVDPRRPGSGVNEHTVRSVDIAPTILDLLAMSVPKSMDGVSLKPYLESRSADLALAAFHETGVWLTHIPGIPEDHVTYPTILDLLEIPDKHTGTLAIKPEFNDIIIEAKDRMIRTDRWKLTYQPLWEGALFKLFDLTKDPNCELDVSAEFPDIFKAMKERLIAWLSQEPGRVWRKEHILSATSPQLLQEIPNESKCSTHVQNSNILGVPLTKNNA